MSEPLEITTALEQIEHASSPNRQLARERIARFRLDKDKGEKPLPVSNATTGSGAPLLDVARTLSHEHHDRRLGKKR